MIRDNLPPVFSLRPKKYQRKEKLLVDLDNIRTAFEEEIKEKEEYIRNIKTKVYMGGNTVDIVIEDEHGKQLNIVNLRHDIYAQINNMKEKEKNIFNECKEGLIKYFEDIIKCIKEGKNIICNICNNFPSKCLCATTKCYDCLKLKNKCKCKV